MLKVGIIYAVSPFASIVEAVKQTMFGDFSPVLLQKDIHALLRATKLRIEVVIKEEAPTTRKLRPDSFSGIEQTIFQITVDQGQAKRTGDIWQTVLKVAFYWINYVLEAQSSDFLLHILI